MSEADMRTIDLNCDLGEIPLQMERGIDEALMDLVTSVNVACGGHAGDEATMRATVQAAYRRGLAIGAHPSYPDLVGFGRQELQMTSDELADAILAQLLALSRVMRSCGATLHHVKPHGALYHVAARHPEIAGAVAAACARFGQDVILVGLAGSPMLEVCRAAGFRVVAEAFADRRYDADGTLRPRHLEGALLSAAEAEIQALRLAEREEVVTAGGQVVAISAQTLCLHGDSPGAVEIAAAVRRALASARVTIRSF
jgi:UPF0271 protein